MTNPFSWSVDTLDQRINETEQRIRDNDPALTAVFTQTFFEQARQQVSSLNQFSNSALSGAIVSVKDLFDVAGFVTKAGTQFMASNQPAQTDAPTIESLRKAGAVFIGHTNMTELAYSGLGLNPHYGTPENALIKGAIPGGSTAGGAVSVALGVADIAIGTDTGGSLRIPAAFNGIVGFKPTQNTVSRSGCKALSRSLDSVGPMAQSVAACKLAYELLAKPDVDNTKELNVEFIIPTNYGMDDLAPEVQQAFDKAVTLLVDAGYSVEKKAIATLEALKTLPVWHFSAIESRGEYDDAYQNQRELIDPRVASATRMGRADEVDAISYCKTLNSRQELIERYQQELGNKILLMPTVPILPPSLKSMEDDDEYGRVNLQVLRNPSIANVLECCSISLPFKDQSASIGIMLTATAGHDINLLNLAEKIEGSFPA